MAALFGKLPSRGDFLTRRLPPRFVEAWDGWLQQAIAESQRRLDDEWLDCYLVAPLWRFVLPPGTSGAAAMAGVLVPSVDRVGRYFPLTLAAEVGALPDAAALFAEWREWFDGFEDFALEALSPDLDLDAFDQRLAAYGVPPPAEAAAPRTRHSSAEVPDCMALSAPAGVEDPGARKAWEAIVGALPSASGLWETGRSDWWGRMYLACPGLPPPGCFAALLDGLWEHHGWELRLPQAVS